VLVLIHGSAATSRSWDALVPLLAVSHHVVRIDLPGHGRSAEPVGRGYATPEQARTLGTALDRLGVKHAIAVGHSSGGYAVTALAEQRPDLVTALVLINTGPSLGAFIGPGPAAIDPAQWPPTDEQIRQFVSTAFREGYPVPQELVDEIRAMNYRAVTAAMQASTVYLNQQAIPDRLTALGRPLHVIFGDQDRRWRPRFSWPSPTAVREGGRPRERTPSGSSVALPRRVQEELTGFSPSGLNTAGTATCATNYARGYGSSTT
jgi:pimeloyl-ACP methyl ester carboxylesterase